MAAERLRTSHLVKVPVGTLLEHLGATALELEHAGRRSSGIRALRDSLIRKLVRAGIPTRTIATYAGLSRASVQRVADLSRKER